MSTKYSSKGAIEGNTSDEIPDETALVAANNQIDLSHQPKRTSGDVVEEEEEEEEEIWFVN